MNSRNSRWSTDVGYDDSDADQSLEGDLLEDIELLLERKLGELFSKIQNLSKPQLPSTKSFPPITLGSTSSHQLVKDQETIKELETKSCLETSNSNSG